MKKDVFTVWIKEFCALVFTQAVQAFLLAIIMSVVLATAAPTSDTNRGTDASATGLIAIVALVSISKVEALVKKIFGIESTVSDPSMKSGMAGLAGTLIGAKLAGRVLNNAGKVGGGIHDTIKGRAAEKKAKADLARGLNKLNKKYGVDSNGNPIDPTTANTAATAVGAAAVGAAAGGAMGSALVGGTNNGNISLNPNNLVVNANNVKMDGKDDKYEDKKEELLEKYQEAIDKAKEQRVNGRLKALSGVTETAGAGVGATAGAVIGMATGDNIMRNAGIGMGVGDFMGETPIQAAKSIREVTVDIKDNSSNKKSVQEAVSALTGEDIDSYRKSIKALEQYTSRLDSASKEAKKKIDAGNV